jgi:hypothetical protein
MELAAGRVDAAIKRFRQALQLDPALVEAHNALGIAHGQRGSFTEAAAAFRAGLAHAPDAPHLLNNLGYALMRAGLLDEAWDSLDRAYRLDKTNPQTRENLVQLVATRAQQSALARTPAASPVASSAAVTAKPAAAEPSATPPVAVAPAPQQAAAVRTEVVRAPTATFTSSLQGAEVIQSAQGRLEQLAPGVLELRPATVVASASRAETATLAPAGMSSGAATVPAAPSRSAQVILPPPPPAAVVVRTAVRPASAPPLVPPAARLAAVGGARAVEGFEVSNGVGIRNLAGRMARALDRLGVSVDRISDYRWFGIRRSEIHYRDGHRDAALAVAGTLPVKPRFVRSTRMQKSINLRLVVGRDLSDRQLAWLGEEALMQADLADESPSALHAPASGADDGRAGIVQVASAESIRGWRHF